MLGIYGGFFSGGYTTLMTVLCTVCFSLTMMESVAVTKPVNLVSCAAASVIFFWGGIIDLRIGLPLAAANLAGGWLGAHAAIKGGDRFVRLLFLLTVAALAAKLIVWDVIRHISRPRQACRGARDYLTGEGAARRSPRRRPSDCVGGALGTEVDDTTDGSSVVTAFHPHGDVNV